MTLLELENMMSKTILIVLSSLLVLLITGQDEQHAKYI